MYKLFAYSVVLNEEYSEVAPQLFKNREQAKQYGVANNIAAPNIVQLYRFHHVKETVPVVVENPDNKTDTVSEPVEP